MKLPDILRTPCGLVEYPAMNVALLLKNSKAVVAGCHANYATCVY